MSEANRGITEHTISIPIGHATIEGTLSRPESPTGLIVFAHGSGSSRFSRRNRFVAAALNDAGFATLLLDLLTRREEEVDELTRAHRFDIALLADRVVAAADWIGADTELSALPIGLFGASTGAAAALVAAGRRREIVHAVVSRGGRPDLAGKDLSGVSAPTLLIVGGADDLVIDLNERARDAMRAEVRLEIIPGATHLFEEPGALAQVAELARDWFLLHLHRESASPARR